MQKGALRCPDKQKTRLHRLLCNKGFSTCTNNIAYERKCLAFFTCTILVLQVSRQKSYGINKMVLIFKII